MNQEKQDYERFKIKDYQYWAVYLHKSQYYLGRMYIAAKRETIADFMAMAKREREELFTQAGPSVKNALIDFSLPDRFNYASLGNEWDHLHVHVIPRYASQRVFDGTVFRDGRWGKNYAPYDKEFQVSEETLMKIKNQIQQRLR